MRAGAGPWRAVPLLLLALLAVGGCERVTERPELVVAAPAVVAPAMPSPAAAAAGVPVAPAQATAPRRPELHLAQPVFGRPRAAAAEWVEPDGISLNFVNADIREVLRVLLGDRLGLNYVVAPGVQGEVTLQTNAPVPRDSLLSIVESLLQANGAALLAGDGIYRVVPAQEVGRGGGVGFGTGPAVIGQAVRVVPLRHVAAAEMQRLLEAVVPQGVAEAAEDHPLGPKGPTGFGVRLIDALIG